MKVFGLLGKNISYSSSKIIHDKISDFFNLTSTYYIFDYSEENIPKLISDLKEKKIRGFNVTIPYKVKVINYVDELTEIAKVIGAVNTVYLKDGKVIGDNTDYYGFVSLLKFHNIDVENKNVYLLGAGGAAKTCYYALTNMKANVKVVKNVNADLNYFKDVITKDEIDIDWPDIYVQATPVGTYPHINESFIDPMLVKEKIVIDLIYNPTLTRLAKSAKEGYNGAVMLLEQALHAQKIWHGNTFDYDNEMVLRLKEEVGLWIHSGNYSK